MVILGIRNFLWSSFMFLTKAEEHVQKNKEGVQSRGLYWFKMPVRHQSGDYAHYWVCVQLRREVWGGGRNLAASKACAIQRRAGHSDQGRAAGEGRRRNQALHLSAGSQVLLVHSTHLDSSA